MPALTEPVAHTIGFAVCGSSLPRHGKATDRKISGPRYPLWGRFLLE